MYNFLSFLNIIIGVCCGRLVASDRIQTTRQYWMIMFFPILVFTITYGLRYGWLIDFNLYEEVYRTILYNETIQKGWLFDLLLRICKSFDWPFNVVVTITDAIIIISYCAFIKPYKEYAYWILPVFYFLSFMCSNFMAFYPALSLFLLAIGKHLQLDNKFDIWHPIQSGLIYPILLLILAFGFHQAVVAGLLLYLIVLVVNIKPTVAIVIYVISFFFVQDWWMSLLKSLSLYASLFGGSVFSSYFDNYVTGADTFFNNEGTQMKEFGGSLFYIIRTIIANGFAFVLYYKYRVENNIDNSKNKILELAFVGLVFSNIAGGVPVFSRFGIPFELVLPVFYAFAINYAFRSNELKNELMAWYIIIIQGYFYFITMYLRDTTHFYYIWDSVKQNIYY